MQPITRVVENQAKLVDFGLATRVLSTTTDRMQYEYTGWPKKVSHYQDSSLNRIKNGYISHQF